MGRRVTEFAPHPRHFFGKAMLHNPANNPQGIKSVNFRSAMPASVTVQQWLIYHLTVENALIGRSRNGPDLRPPEYRDLLQARFSDLRE